MMEPVTIKGPVGERGKHRGWWVVDASGTVWVPPGYVDKGKMSDMIKKKKGGGKLSEASCRKKLTEPEWLEKLRRVHVSTEWRENHGVCGTAPSLYLLSDVVAQGVLEQTEEWEQA